MPADITAVVSELGAYIKQGNGQVADWIYGPESEYTPYVSTLAKIDGTYPSISGMMTHVVQEFKPVWNALGQSKFFAKKLESFRQKVNFTERPKNLYNSWMSATQVAAMEGRRPDQEPLALWTMERLKKKVQHDLRILEATGVFVANTGLFGDSMDGMITVLQDMMATGNPFKIPVPVITSTNIVDVVDIFDLSVPSHMRDMCPAYFMSETNLNLYRRRYRALHGTNTDYTNGQTTMTWINGKMLVGFKYWNGSDVIMTTVEGNWVKLIDLIDAPEINDLQVVDYDVKFFMEFSLAYNMMLDEVTFISDPGGLVRGLATNHTLWYPEESTDPITLT